MMLRIYDAISIFLCLQSRVKFNQISTRRRVHLCKVLTLFVFFSQNLLLFFSDCVWTKIAHRTRPIGSLFFSFYVIKRISMHLDGTQSILFCLLLVAVVVLLLLLLSICNDLAGIEIANFLYIFFFYIIVYGFPFIFCSTYFICLIMYDFDLDPFCREFIDFMAFKKFYEKILLITSIIYLKSWASIYPSRIVISKCAQIIVAFPG